MLGDWATGKLEPRRFAILWAAIILGLILLLFLALAWATTMVTLFKSDGTTQSVAWGGATLLSLFLLLLAALFNITVKRGRDIGVPGIVMAAGFLILLVMAGIPVFLTIFLAMLPSRFLSNVRV